MDFLSNVGPISVRAEACAGAPATSIAKALTPLTKAAPALFLSTHDLTFVSSLSALSHVDERDVAALSGFHRVYVRGGGHPSHNSRIFFRFLRPSQVTRVPARPERTVYQITGEGAETLQQWLRTMLSRPAREFPEFPAALAFVPILEPEDVLRQLETREEALTQRIDALDEALRIDDFVLPRLFLLESEYERAVFDAEVKWVRAVVQDLRSDRLTWSYDWRRRLATQPGVRSGEQ